MSAYRDALVVDQASSDARVALAAKMLSSSEGVVLLEGLVALRPDTDAILCEVLDPMPSSHRCAEEFGVLIENAKRALEASKLGDRLPDKPLRWIVVDDYGTGIVQPWPEC